GTYHEGDAPGVASQVQRRLSSRVRAAEDVDVLAGDGGCLGSRTAIEDAGAVQRLDLRDAEAAVADAGGQEQRASAQSAAVGEGHEYPAGRPGQAGHLLHEREVRPEDPRLLVRLQGQAAAA